MGWTGKILRVDLTAGTCVSEPLNREWAEQYMGQRGLATKYLMESMDPAVDALDPGNVLIFATGPLTGTMAPTAGRYAVITKGALTGAIACSNSGGKVGAEIKLAGWDMVVIHGRSERPVYLWICDDRAELRDAGHLWGRSVWEVEPAIKTELGDPAVKVASIGRAGERLVRFACVVNELHRAAGRSGVGAVMGSKNLKAVAARGTGGVTVHDPRAFMAAVANAKGTLQPHASRQRLMKLGTHAMMDVTNAHGSLPTRNERDVQFEGTDKLNAAASQKPHGPNGVTNLVTNKACFACTIACGRIAQIDPEHFSIKGKPQYHTASGGLEYENVFALGAMVGVDDIDAVTFANFVCNEDGMDTISYGGSLAAAMELFEEGAITLEDTGGIDLSFGSAEGLVAMTELTARGEGFGAMVGLGARRLTEKYGRPELAMVSKGQEFAGYDPRAMQGMALAYATSNRGACHLRASPFASDFQTAELEGKAEIVRASQDERAAMFDSAGICAFIAAAVNIDQIAGMLDGALESHWDADRIRLTGERIWNLEKLFNLKAGLTRKDDSLPSRMLHEPVKTGTAKGQVARLDELLPEYYALRGWDEEGVPRGQTLTRLGLT
ncbi:MAG: aldehyde ferredoxin oxidoreductase family protein [Proteobacteria bacterium]|nr:aldehyde ferredoxin oxidoreductase family protein [Pseudomonadota bacterium]